MRTYTAEQKAAALAIYKERGLGAAWRETGIPKPTVAAWARKGGIQNPTSDQIRHMVDNWRETLALRREQLRVEILEKASDMLDRMDAEHIDFKGKDADEVTYPIAPAEAVRNYAVTFGILIDKFRLEMGEVTDRTEHHGITDDLPADVKRALRERLARSVRGESVAAGAPGDPERAAGPVDPAAAPGAAAG